MSSFRRSWHCSYRRCSIFAQLPSFGEGVFLVGGNGTYAMFVEMADHVVAVGGTAGIPERIKLLREEVPDKPIRYGVLTHHHVDHLQGVAPYLQEGATVFTVKAHEAIVRRTANSDKLKLEFVDGKRVLQDGSRSVELYDVGPTPHSEHLVVAWLPNEGILFEADYWPKLVLSCWVCSALSSLEMPA